MNLYINNLVGLEIYEGTLINVEINTLETELNIVDRFVISSHNLTDNMVPCGLLS